MELYGNQARISKGQTLCYNEAMIKIMQTARPYRRVRTLALFVALALLLLPACTTAMEPLPSAFSARPVTTETPGVVSPSLSPATMPALTPTPVPTPLPTETPVPTEPPAPTATPRPTLDPNLTAEEVVAAMTDMELLGQMVMLGFSGTETMPEDVAALYRDYKVGGVMLFGWNVKNFEQTKRLTTALEESNPTPQLPLFIAIDEEGGIVHRLPWKPATRSAATLGRRNNTKEVYEQYLRVAKELRRIGVNFNFAPVLDIAPDPSQTFMGNRMFGTEPKKVSKLIGYAIDGTQDGGALALGKHFPGHGLTADDSHKVLPVVNATKAELKAYALKPFAAAIEKNVDAILVGHLLVPALDSKYPASLSKNVITGLLRQEMGYQGLVFSDDMRMGAITSNYNIGEACVKFVLAGGDVVLVGKFPNKQKAALEALAKAVESGRITRARLEESALRIVRAKMGLMANKDS